MKVTLVGMSQTNWQDFIEIPTLVLGRSPARSLDAARLRPGDLASYITALTELEKKDSVPRDTIIEADWQLDFISLTFLVTLNDREANELRLLPGLSSMLFDDSQDYLLVIITGNLNNYKNQTIKALISANKNLVKRELFTGVYEYLRRLGLRNLFYEYSETLIDGLAFLELK